MLFVLEIVEFKSETSYRLSNVSAKMHSLWYVRLVFITQNTLSTLH